MQERANLSIFYFLKVTSGMTESFANYNKKVLSSAGYFRQSEPQNKLSFEITGSTTSMSWFLQNITRTIAGLANLLIFFQGFD
jgi:hypothetical protein